MTPVSDKIRHFRLRMTMVMMLGLLPACVLLLVLDYIWLWHEVDHARDRARGTVELTSIKLTATVATPAVVVELLAAVPDDLVADRARCEGVLASARSAHPQLRLLAFVDPEGGPVCAAFAEGVDGRLADAVTRALVHDALFAGGTRIVYRDRRDVGRHPSVLAARAVSNRAGEVTGVVLAGKDFTRIQTRLAPRMHGSREMVMIVDDAGRVVWRHPEPDPSEPVLLDPDVLSRLASMEDGTEFEQGTERLWSLDRRVFARALPGTDLSVVLVLDEAGVMSDKWNLAVVGLIIVGCVALVGLAVIWFGVGRLYGRRLGRITLAAQEFVAGDLRARAPVARSGGLFDEIDVISDAFNAMADTLAAQEQSRRSASVELAISRNLNAAILDSLTHSIAVLDWNGRIVAVNERWREAARSGNADDRVADGVGLDYLGACSAPDPGESEPSEAYSGLRRILNREIDHFAMEYPCALADGMHYFEVRMTPLRSQDGVVVAHEDITERKRVSLRMEQLVGELERSNRDLQDFAYVASHDLQEPLRKINAFAERLRSAYAGALDARGLDYLQRMSDAARRMQELIEDLLKLSRVATQAAPMRTVALDKPLADALSDLEERVQGTGAHLTLGTLPRVEADPTQLRQVFLNLIGNALKFVEQGAVPDIEISAGDRGQGRVEVRVCDRGIGLPEADRERVFNPFVRLHGRTEYAGTGLGLAVVKRIVERHGGTVQASARPDGGTCFSFDLRRADENAENP